MIKQTKDLLNNLSVLLFLFEGARKRKKKAQKSFARKNNKTFRKFNEKTLSILELKFIDEQANDIKQHY